MTDTKPHIVVKNLFKVFGPEPDEAITLAERGLDKDEIFRRTGSVVAVNNVSMEVREREIFVVMGLSGSGKSTLVRCFNRLFEPTRGSIEIDGENLLDADKERLRELRLHKLTMVFQHFALLPHRTVAENVEYGLKVRGIDQRERRLKALEALEAVGLDAWADVLPQDLSGGMQQRVGLARALAVDPEIMLMDEPFSALDPLIRREMQDELARIQERYRTTIIFITHDLNEALKLGDHVAIMKNGRFVQVGKPEKIVAAPADTYVSAFTQDVDRGRVLTVGSLAKDPDVLSADSDNVDVARRRIEKEQCDALYAVDKNGRAEGVLLARDLANREGSEPIRPILRPDFPEARPDEALFEVYERCGMGLPLAVVNDEGRLTGVVSPHEILMNLQSSANEAAANADDPSVTVAQ